MRGATKGVLQWQKRIGISTHAPLAGRDSVAGAAGPLYNDFNPRAPCGARHGGEASDYDKFQISTHAPLAGRDQDRAPAYTTDKTFQPTRPLRGATLTFFLMRRPQNLFQPTRPLRGATVILWLTAKSYLFQPTRPLRGATPSGATVVVKGDLFQPTRPLRGATAIPTGAKAAQKRISTHAPLAGRDAAGK